MALFPHLSLQEVERALAAANGDTNKAAEMLLQ